MLSDQFSVTEFYLEKISFLYQVSFSLFRLEKHQGGFRKENGTLDVIFKLSTLKAKKMTLGHHI